MEIVNFVKRPEDFSKIDCSHIHHWSFTPVGSAQRQRSIEYFDQIQRSIKLGITTTDKP